MKTVLPRTLPLLIFCFFLSVSANARFFSVKHSVNQSLTITAPANVMVNTDPFSNVATNVVLGTPLITDDISIVSITNNAPASYPIGVTNITWTVIDNAGNLASATQTVTVSDKEKPVIGRMGEISVVNETGKCGATVALFIPYAYDNSGVVTVTNNAPAFFTVGSVKIIWTATDMYGNSDTSTQMITVIDNEFPTISIGNIHAINDAGKCGAVVNLGTPTTFDNCGIASVTNNAPSFFPVGITLVKWVVTDIHNYTATTTQTVTITDTQKPTITAPSSKTITLPKGATVATAVNLGTPTTADNCAVNSVTNNAPPNYPIGKTTVIWTVKDNSGNVANALQIVTVKAYTSGKNFSVSQSPASTTKEIILEEQSEKLLLFIAPNPSAAYFRLKMESKSDLPISLIVLDVTGRVMDAKSKLAANSSVLIGQNYHAGTYFAEMIQGKQRKVVQLIKLK